MKIIRIIFFFFLALALIVCMGIFIFFETFDADQYLAQITQKASIALGRPVSLGHISLGFSDQGITFDAGPLAVADDASFTKQPFITVDRIRISLDLEPLILHREIHIRNILLQSPQIHFIRSEEGQINAHGIGSKPSPSQSDVNLPQGGASASPLNASALKTRFFADRLGQINKNSVIANPEGVKQSLKEQQN